MWFICLYCLEFIHTRETCPWCGSEFLEPVQPEDKWGVKSSHSVAIIVELSHAEAK